MPFEYTIPAEHEWKPATMPTKHDPNHRDCMIKLVGWQVRVVMRNDARHTPMAAQGILHLQLWHAGTQTSILTPSNLTNRCFEIWHEAMHLQVENYQKVAEIIAEDIGLRMPCSGLIHHYQCWLAWAPCIGVVDHTAPQHAVLMDGIEF